MKIIKRLIFSLFPRDPLQGFWEARFDELAAYNSEVARGIQHAPQKTQKMQAMQSEYDDKMCRMIKASESC